MPKSIPSQGDENSTSKRFDKRMNYGAKAENPPNDTRVKREADTKKPPV